MEQLFQGVALAALSALTFVAYKHPDGYWNILKVLRIILPAIFVGALIWDICVSRTYSELVSFIQVDQFNEARAAAESRKLLSSSKIAAYVTIMFYLEFLAWLSGLLTQKSLGGAGADFPPNFISE